MEPDAECTAAADDLLVSSVLVAESPVNDVEPIICKNTLTEENELLNLTRNEKDDDFENRLLTQSSNSQVIRTDQCGQEKVNIISEEQDSVIESFADGLHKEDDNDKSTQNGNGTTAALELREEKPINDDETSTRNVSSIATTLASSSTSSPVSSSPIDHPSVSAAKSKHPISSKPGTTCTDVSQAIEILRTSYTLSEVNIRKDAMTRTSWNISDVIRFPSEMSAEESDEILEEKEFRLEMEELCRKIDRKDREIFMLLDHILLIAERNAYVRDENVCTSDLTVTSRPQSRPNTASSGQAAEATVDTQCEKRNLFSRMLRTLRRGISRRK